MILLTIFNQISHEALDPPIDERTSDNAVKQRLKMMGPFFIGQSMQVSGFALLLTSIGILQSLLIILI